MHRTSSRAFNLWIFSDADSADVWTPLVTGLCQSDSWETMQLREMGANETVGCLAEKLTQSLDQARNVFTKRFLDDLQP